MKTWKIKNEIGEGVIFIKFQNGKIEPPAPWTI